MTSRGTQSRFLQSVLQNGVGRYVCQLKRISLVFSKKGQSSLGVREFIEEGVVDFAKKNPGTVVYVSPQQCNVPKIVAEYCDARTPRQTQRKWQREGGSHSVQDVSADCRADNQTDEPVRPGYHSYPQAFPYRQSQHPGPMASLHEPATIH
uniref:Large ribosomal subunit protein mL43 n=1 Tax=Esox lucius TaxID=8010 RepID=A0AAY5KAA5_ESOLU